jgi:hypothetical protein
VQTMEVEADGVLAEDKEEEKNKTKDTKMSERLSRCDNDVTRSLLTYS